MAIKSQEKFQLEYSIKEFQKAELSDDDMDLEKAVQLLRKISAKDGEVLKYLVWCCTHFQMQKNLGQLYIFKIRVLFVLH